MKSDSVYLLDVNVMLALTQPDHLHAGAAHRWWNQLPDGSRLATCPITEASFLRLAMNPKLADREPNFTSAVEKLKALLEPGTGAFLADPTSLAYPRIDATRIYGHQQVTDFHLVNLAAASDAILATFDRRIVEALALEDRKYVELIPG